MVFVFQEAHLLFLQEEFPFDLVQGLEGLKYLGSL